MQIVLDTFFHTVHGLFLTCSVQRENHMYFSIQSENLVILVTLLSTNSCLFSPSSAPTGYASPFLLLLPALVD